MIAAAHAVRSATAAQPAASKGLAENSTPGSTKTTGYAPDDPQLREAFGSALGQTFYGQMLKAMRQTVGKSKYFHGGRGEEIFQQQLDQLVVEKMSRSGASSMIDPMFEQFQLQRGQ